MTRPPDPTDAAPLPGRLETLEYWIEEREAVRALRDSGIPPPWSEDPIFRQHRFRNVIRMDDWISRWLLLWYARQRKAWGSLDAAEEWRRMLVLVAAGRLINHPVPLRALPPLFPYDPDIIMAALRQSEAEGTKLRNTHGVAVAPDRITHLALAGLWDHPPARHTDSMERPYLDLCGRPGIGPFTAGQIVGDLRHALPGAWLDCASWAPTGPACIRGLRLLYGPACTKSRALMLLRRTMTLLRERGRVARGLLDRMEMMDAQGAISEYGRYMQLRMDARPPRGVYRSRSAERSAANG